MDFDKLHDLASTIPDKINKIQNEDAAKLVFVQPFISALGYNLYDPAEVMPEHPMFDSGKKNDYVDFAILRDDVPIILIECKWDGANNIDLGNKDYYYQLKKYFNLSPAKFGILTNGILYKVFSEDPDNPGKMDKIPFLELNLLKVKDPIITDINVIEMKNFSKPMDIEAAKNRALYLKKMKEIRAIIAEIFDHPSEDFVRFIAKQSHVPYLGDKVVKEYAELTKDAINKYISERIKEKLEPALDTKSKNKTTKDELEAYYIIKTLLGDIAEPDQIITKESENLLDIIYVDGSSQTVVCRLYLNDRAKYIGLFDENGNEVKYSIDSIDDINQYSDQIVSIIKPNGEKSFIFEGQIYKLDLWKDMLPKVCEIMAERHKNEFGTVLGIKGSKHNYFSKDPNEFKYGVKIKGTDIYVNTNVSPWDHLNRSRKVVAKFGYSKEEIKLIKQ